MLEEISRKFGHNAHLYILAFLLVSFVVFFAGGITSKNKQNFMIVKENYVVLKEIEEYFLIANFDRTTNELSTEYELINVQDLSIFNYENIGKLIVSSLKK